jgi:ABC-type glycerol-3-phosphate transport system substrate-binding protein
MKRSRLMLAVCAGIAALASTSPSAAAPSAPPGCTTVLTTPAVTTGAPQALAQKEAAYTRVCLS